LIQNGHILSVDTPSNIVNTYPDKLYAVTGSNMPHLLKLINHDEQVLSAYSFGENIHVTFKNNDTNIDEATASWAGHGIENIVAKPAQATIEDSFIKLLKD
jgi:ABC-2 type transport system ATP-binding protein